MLWPFILVFAIINDLCLAANPRPHVVLIVADDYGWNDVGFHGSNQIPTPNLDALAYSGITLQNYYTLPICTPSRSALMTGMHPIHTGMQHRVILSPEPWGLPLDVKILPQYLKDDGYKTHAVGKWHLGFFEAAYTPERRGFDSHFGYWTGRHDYYDHTSQVSSSWGYDMRRGLNTSWESYGRYTTDLITDESVQLIRNHDVTLPLFLYVAHLAVHSANDYQFLEAPAEVIEKFSYIKNPERRTYAAMVWKMDESVGKIVATLNERDMLHNTIIVFTTDNGGAAAGFNHNSASNWPLRGVKDTLWEGGVHGNAFIWSQQLPASKVNTELMHIQDWLPTILVAVNSSAIQNGDLKIDGHDMWPALNGTKSNVYDELLLNIDQVRNLSALRKGDWKIISGDAYFGKWNGHYGPSGRSAELVYNMSAVENSYVAKAFRKDNIQFPSRQTINEMRKNLSIACNAQVQGRACDLNKANCLYNIKTDPCELDNQANEYPQKLNQLVTLLGKYKPMKERNKPPDPRSNPKFWNYTWSNWMDYVI